MRLVLYRGYWCVYHGAGKRTSLRTKDRSVAEARLSQFLEPGPRVGTVGDCVEQYIEAKKGIASHERIIFAWNAAKATYANLRPSEITPELCRRYQQTRSVSDATVRRELGIIKAALKWAGATGARFELPPSSPPRDRVLTRDEAKRLIDASTSEHIALFIQLAIATAGRAGAILELEWDRVDFSRGLIDLRHRDVRTRAKGRSVVPITDTMRPILRSAYDTRSSGFVIEWAGSPVRSIKKAFARTAHKAGLNDVTPHTLRHTAAVWMAESGVPMSVIAQYLGHSDSRITERVYARFSPDYLRNAARALE